jgi:hypothetical protein
LFFVKINKIEKPLSRLSKQEREGAQITKVRDKRGDIINNIKIKQCLREY